MKKNWKRIASLFLSLLLFLSMTGTPVMASGEKAAPTEVKNCEASGFWTTVLNLSFEDADWLNAIDSVTVNEEKYTKQTISSFGSDTKIWEVGNATGSYGSYTALKLAIPSNLTFPATIKVTAEGYQDLTVEITKTKVSYNDVYTATVKKGTTGGNTEATYTATAQKASNGTVALDKDKDLKAGDTVTVTATPADNYEVDTVSVTTDSGKNVDVTNSEKKYTFTMPAENVKVSAAFKEKTPAQNGVIELSQVSLGTDTFGNSWELTFEDGGG